MDFSRIVTVIDITKTQAAMVTVIGAGGAADLIVNLARCGVGHLILIDFDTVTAANIARQGHHVDDVGRLKIEAVAGMIRRLPARHTGGQTHERDD